MGVVKLPSGKTAKVPDGLSEDEVLELLFDKLPKGEDKDRIGDRLDTSGWGATIGGLVGGVGGSIGGIFTSPSLVVNPLTLGAAGGAAGAAAGEGIEQWLTGRGDWDDIAKEGAIGGATGLIPGQLGRGSRVVSKVASEAAKQGGRKAGLLAGTKQLGKETARVGSNIPAGIAHIGKEAGKGAVLGGAAGGIGGGIESVFTGGNPLEGAKKGALYGGLLGGGLGAGKVVKYLPYASHAKGLLGGFESIPGFAEGVGSKLSRHLGFNSNLNNKLLKDAWENPILELGSIKFDKHINKLIKKGNPVDLAKEAEKEITAKALARYKSVYGVHPSAKERQEMVDRIKDSVSRFDSSDFKVGSLEGKAIRTPNLESNVDRITSSLKSPQEQLKGLNFSAHLSKLTGKGKAVNVAAEAEELLTTKALKEFEDVYKVAPSSKERKLLTDSVKDSLRGIDEASLQTGKRPVRTTNAEANVKIITKPLEDVRTTLTDNGFDDYILDVIKKRGNGQFESKEFSKLLDTFLLRTTKDQFKKQFGSEINEKELRILKRHLKDLHEHVTDVDDIIVGKLKGNEDLRIAHAQTYRDERKAADRSAKQYEKAASKRREKARQEAEVEAKEEELKFYHAQQRINPTDPTTGEGIFKEGYYDYARGGMVGLLGRRM